MLVQAILISAALGFIISAYSTYSHYSASTETFCDFGATVSCSVVNKSIYSEIVGIPVAIIGMAGYLLIGALVLAKTSWKWPFAASVLGLVFSGYLTWIEIFALQTYCILCLASQFLMLAITIFSGILYTNEHNPPDRL